MNKWTILIFLCFFMHTSCSFKRKHDFYVGFYGGFKNYEINLILNKRNVFSKRLETNYSIVKAGGFAFSSYTGDTLIIMVDDFDSDTVILDKKRPYIPISIKDSMIFYEKPVKRNIW